VGVPVEAVAVPLAADERHRLVRRAQLLAWSSLVWMTAEGAIAIGAGIAAGSIALIGFGIDSAIEGMASVVIIWRFWGKRALSEAVERRAQKLVAVQFFILAPYVAIEAVRTLITSDHPDVSRLGIALTAISLVLMPCFGVAKRRVGERLGSRATQGEGMQNILCAYLSAAVLAGLGANALFGWWWADPVAALVIAVVAAREGLESWRGEEALASAASAGR
jgi:divalent metal cation (Fe/Co/Zn/Cd) transporter